MPFDPTFPQAGTEIDALQMRAQLNALNDDLQTRATVSQMVIGDSNVLNQSSANSNSVAPIDFSADSSYNQGQQQALFDAFNALVYAPRR